MIKKKFVKSARKDDGIVWGTKKYFNSLNYTDINYYMPENVMLKLNNRIIEKFDNLNYNTKSNDSNKIIILLIFILINFLFIKFSK